jgi:hypothetical protein
MSDKLTPTQRAALLVLMASPTRKMSNNDLFEVAHFRLHGQERKPLNKAGWVETDETATPHVHALTEAGMRRCVEELKTPAPERAGSPLVGALYAVLGGLDRHLHRTGYSLSAIFQGEEKDAAPADTESLIRTAYRGLAREPGGWVSMADLRDKLGEVPSVAIETALRQMIRKPGVMLIPEADQASLRPRDRQAAVRIGGEYKDLLAIEGL